MVYIYIYANKTGVKIDGKCGSINMAHIRIRHGFDTLQLMTGFLAGSRLGGANGNTEPMHDTT